MARRSAPTTDPRVIELAQRLREFAREQTGPDATFEEFESCVGAIRGEIAADALREERAASVAGAPPPPPVRAKPRRR